MVGEPNEVIQKLAFRITRMAEERSDRRTIRRADSSGY